MIKLILVSLLRTLRLPRHTPAMVTVAPLVLPTEGTGITLIAALLTSAAAIPEEAEQSLRLSTLQNRRDIFDNCFLNTFTAI